MMVAEREIQCCICTADVEEWDGGGGYGHNPDPLGCNPEDRACNWCNQNIIIPVRLRQVGVGAARQSRREA